MKIARMSRGWKVLLGACTYLHKCEKIVRKTQPLLTPIVLLKNHCEFVFTAKDIAECKKLTSLTVNTNYQWLIKQIIEQERKKL